MLHILTPQNPGAGELYSLVRFLRIFPYAYYFCRKAGGCDCQSLDHKFKNRRACHHCGCAHPISSATATQESMHALLQRLDTVAFTVSLLD